MAQVDVVPNRATISFANYVTTATSVLNVTSEQALYPAVNLLDEYRSTRWRSVAGTTATGGAQVLVTFQLASPLLPTVVGMVNGNFTSSTAPGLTWKLVASDDSAITLNPVTYQFLCYPQSSTNRTNRFYLGTPAAGTAHAARYWTLAFLPGTASGFSPYTIDNNDTFFEIGTFWLGSYTEIPLEFTTRIRQIPQSKSDKSWAGTRYDDVLPAYHEIEVNLANLDETAAYALRTSIDTSGGNKHLLLDLFGNATTSTKKAHGTFYGTIDPKSMEVVSIRTNNLLDMKFTLRESAF